MKDKPSRLLFENLQFLMFKKQFGQFQKKKKKKKGDDVNMCPEKKDYLDIKN